MGRRLLPALFLFLVAAGADAQTTGSIVGRVVDAASDQPLAGVDITLDRLPHRVTTDAQGRFVIGSVPAGERALRLDFIGYKPLVLERLQIISGRSIELRLALESSPVEVAPLVVRADRVRLIEPEVTTSHEVIIGRELRELPVDEIDKVIELTAGVSGGHFRGGRIGQELYVIDGIPLKNQLEASENGFTLELSPTSLDEVDVVTGGFGAQFGSALSGVVSYTTRRGNPDRWDGALALTSDRFLPESLLQGFTGLTASASGPLRFLGQGATVFADVLLQGKLDADTRGRGLTCVEEGDVEEALAAQIRTLRTDPQLSALYCPYISDQIPHQSGDKYIAFARLDKPFGANWHLTTTLLRNRTQNGLYTSEFKYHPTHQLGQRFTGSLGTATLEWLRNRPTGSTSVNVRAALMRLDRYVGAVDPASFDGADLLGFRPAAFQFIGEDFARQPITDQIALGSAVPGYVAPSTGGNTPFGVAGLGIFYTAGTPTIASWSRTDLASADVTATRVTPGGSTFTLGTSTKLYHVEAYERALAHLAGSMPSYARFYPATVAAFADGTLRTEEDFHFNFGLRVEAFRSGIDFQQSRIDFLSPIVRTDWKVNLMPRLGVGMPVPGTEGRTAVRASFSMVAQPPDFRYFIDSSVGDSLRTDIRRQGNPDLAFEKGSSYEIGISHLSSERVALGVTLFRKTLNNLVSGNLYAAEGGGAQFTTGDFGSVTGGEFTMRLRLAFMTGRASYAIQKAVGRTAGIDADSVIIGEEQARTEMPLAFDRRHAADLSLFFGRAAGLEQPWSAAVTTTAQSGYPLFRATDTGARREVLRYLPWTSSTDVRASWEFGGLGCGRCSWRAVLDARNILGFQNILGLRRESGAVGPTLAQVQQLANSVPLPTSPIPAESPLYVRRLDSNGDGLISSDEMQRARFAAALDRYDPTLFYGDARALRLGVEVVF
jgi:hypothetical protein